MSRPIGAQRLSGGLAFPLLFLTTACGGSLSATASSPQEPPRTVVIATGIDPGYAHLVVAVNQGFLEKYNIDAEYQPFEDGNSSVDAVLTGDADVSGTTEFGGLSRWARGGEIYVLGYGSRATESMGIVVTDAIQEPADLEGKTVGFVEASGGHYLFARYAEHHGLDADSIETTNIQAPESIAVLERGDVDAISIWEPWVSSAVEEVPGTHRLAWAGDDNVYADQVYYYVSQRFIDDPALAADFLRGVIEAEEWIAENPDEAAELVSDTFSMSLEDTRTLMDGWVYRTVYPEDLRSGFEEAAEFMVERDLLDEVPDLDGFLHPEILEAAAPDRVTCGERC